MTTEQADKLRELQLKNYLSMILLSPEVMAEELQVYAIILPRKKGRR